ncbi:glutamate-gated chloride channel isoform X24 [Anopheles arabiensis]|uniref:glutamate-gated chloride channel isoform X24 n=1 Tax=Anopheles arabiensis TaxID=7173 RepID=UPI001AACAC06|nr:glutamate-gated chloride channel isoform X24 [Anopheles arabiensis]
MQNTCHNMGYSCESAHLQYRPVRSDRNQRSWSTEPLQLLDSHQPQATTATDRSCTSDSTTTTITNRSPAPNQPPWATATDSSSTSPTRWNLRTEPTPEGTVAAPVTKRRTSPTEPIAVTSSRWHSSFNLLRAPTAVFDGYSTIVLEKLSRFISRHVAAPQHATPPSVPAIPTTRATTKTTSRSAASPMAHTVTPSSRPAPGSSTSSSTVRRHDDEPCRSDGQPVPLGHRAHRQPTQFHAPSVQRDVAASPTTSRPASSHHLVRHSLCLYAASSVLLALCYLTIPTVASDTAHPIRGRVRFAEGKSDKEILDHLLKNSRYDKRLLPPVDGTLTVNVSVLLLSLASPDESSLKYEVEFLLQQQWFDPRLRYANQSQYEYLNAIHHHEDIWLPDTYFIMHGDFKDPIIPMHFALRIYRNGTINYLMRRHLILSCQGRLNIFPFDDPLCSFALESISYEQSAITYVWKNDEDTLRKSPSLTTLNAYLIQNQTIACPIKASWRAEGQTLSVEDEEFLCNLCQRRFEEQGNYSCLKVDLIFTRDRAFYFTTVFIPGIILVTSSFITFWLEWNAVPARSMIGVTTMLNFFTTSNGFRSTLPVVSNLTAMNVWDGVCMCFIYASLLEFVCVNYVGRKRPLHNVVYRPGENPVTQRLPAVLSRIGIILASPLKRESGGPNEIVACTSCAGGTSPCTHSANNGCATETCFVQVRKKEPPHPIRVAKTIDVIARITFPSAYAVFLIFFFIHYKGFS